MRNADPEHPQMPYAHAIEKLFQLAEEEPTEPKTEDDENGKTPDDEARP